LEAVSACGVSGRVRLAGAAGGVPEVAVRPGYILPWNLLYGVAAVLVLWCWRAMWGWWCCSSARSTSG